jgi:hypothetical protein
MTDTCYYSALRSLPQQRADDFLRLYQETTFSKIPTVQVTQDHLLLCRCCRRNDIMQDMLVKSETAGYAGVSAAPAVLALTILKRSSMMSLMNKLPLVKRAQILSMLCEGSSMRAITRITGVSLNTVTKLLIDAGKACDAYHNEHVRGVKATRIQCDEVWAFCYSKQRNVATAKAAPEGAGDVWTWTALGKPVTR